MEDYKNRRKKEVAEDIKRAMGNAGLTRKQLADKMGRQPSEVTRWLSGTHNFTIDLLSEITEAIVLANAENPDNGQYLYDSGATVAIPGIKVSPYIFSDLCKLARKKNLSVEQFISRTLAEVAATRKNPLDYFGLWSDKDGFTRNDICQELYSLRTTKKPMDL